MRNQLYCGDNLDVLRCCIADESIDLVYLDPPFKSNQNYNLLFREKDGSKSASQILAFEDTWEWNVEAERNYATAVHAGGKLSQIMVQFRTLLGDTDMLAYLSMMAPRLVELQRVLKPTGSIYLHCDPTASHYLKTLMDAIFAPVNFRNEIVWKRSDAHSDAKQGAKHYGRIHDILLYYSKGASPNFRALYNPLPESTTAKWYRHVEEGTGRRFNKADVTGPGGAAKGNPHYDWKGISRYWRYSKENMERLEAEGKLVYSKSGMVYEKRYLDESRGVAVQDWWDDISMLRGIHRNSERLGYPTQKPLALLERIISASSNPGDVILDPFCGCGTAIEAAYKSRNWIGIDVTYQAMRVIREERFPKLGLQVQKSYQMIYRPCDISAAEAFATEQPLAFQDWAVEKLDGIPGRPRSGDRGIDGRLYFREEMDGPLRQILISVKGGKLKAPFVRELQGAVARERAPMGVLITLKEPSKQMIRDAASSGFYSCSSGTYPKIQIITIKDILADVRFELPPIQRMDEFRKRTLAVAAASQMPLPGIAG